MLFNLANAEEAMLALLKGPLERLSQVCREFETAMEEFSRKSEAKIRDWAKMTFMEGDMNESIDTIGGYRSTILVRIRSITLTTTEVSQNVLLEYNQTIQDTAYDLELHQRRMCEKVMQLSVDGLIIPGIGVDLKDERELTEKCLRICEDAKAYLQTLSDSALFALPRTSESVLGDISCEAQLQTSQALKVTRDSFMETIGNLSKRLNDNERRRLLSDIDISQQCLKVCTNASGVLCQKISETREVVAEGGRGDRKVLAALLLSSGITVVIEL